MKKYKKIIIAILGGTNTTFNIFVPIALTLLLVPFVSGWHQVALWVVGILSSFYRAIDTGFLK